MLDKYWAKREYGAIDPDIYDRERFFLPTDKAMSKVEKQTVAELISKNYKAEFGKKMQILDVACGHGFLVKYLREGGYGAVGLDFSKYAGSEIPDSFILHDARNPLPFDDKTFDVVVSIGFLEHLEEQDIDKVYKEMCRVGKVVLAAVGTKQERITEQTHLTLHDRNWWYKKCPGIKLI